MSDKEIKRKCFKCGASPAQDNVVLFRFLKPGVRNLVRCEQWAKYMFPERDVGSEAFKKKLFSEHRMLCDRHFKDEDFTDSSRKHLLRTAVPCDVANTERPKEKDQCSWLKSSDGIVPLDTERPKEKDPFTRQKSNDEIVPLDREPPQEKVPFSWQKSNDGIVPLDEQQDAEDVTFVGQSQLVPDLYDTEEIEALPEFSCNVCHELITGFRYACAQCRDWDLCGACEARGEHATHFVLRIPPHRTLKETQTVLTALRQLLDGIALQEDPDADVIKDEVKTEDPLDEGMAPQEASPAQGDAAAHSGQASERSEPLCAGDSAAGEDEFYDVEYLETESEASMSSDEEPVTDAPRPSTALQKRKLSLHATPAHHSHAAPRKVQKHDDNSFIVHCSHSTSELVEESQIPEPALTEEYSATHGERSDSAVPQRKNKDLLEKCVNRNAVVAPHEVTSSFTATNNLIQKSKGNHKLIALSAEKDCIVSDKNTNKTIIIESPGKSTLSVKEMVELPSLTLGVDANETQQITWDGQPVEIIDSSKELHVNITPLAENEIRTATGSHEGRRLQQYRPGQGRERERKGNTYEYGT